MTKRFSKTFFGRGPVAFVGYSAKNAQYCGEIRTSLGATGLSVLPVNTNPSSTFDVPVAKSLDELPAGTDQAIVLLSGAKALDAVGNLGRLGYRKVLLRSRGIAGDEAVARAQELGMEVAFGCPLMAYGKGLHRFHGFLAGVR